MARPKGYKLSAEQKARMQAGKKAAREKARECLADPTLPEKREQKKRGGVSIIGYIKDGDSVLPVFPSEKALYKGKIFKTAQEAKGNKK
jgi:hypothetical protein